MSPNAPVPDEADERCDSFVRLHVLHAFRSDYFAEAYAQTCAGVPLPYAEFVTIGRELEAMYKKSPGRQAAVLDRIGCRLSKQYLQGETHDPVLLEFINEFYLWAQTKRKISPALGRSDANKLSLAFGVVCGCLKYLLDADAVAAADVDIYADHLAEFVPHVLRGVGISATTARRAIAHHTRHVPLTDWLMAHYPELHRAKLH